MAVARSLMLGAPVSESATAWSRARPRSRVSELSRVAGSTMSGRRCHGAGHLGQSDHGAVLAGRGRGDHDGVAVLEERPRAAVLELDLLLAAPAQLQEAAALVLVRPGDGAGGEQVAG